MSPWTIAKVMLDMNGSPAWNKINKIVGLANMSSKGNSAKTTFKGAVDNSGMYGTYGS